MSVKGDSERQAILRDRMIKAKKKAKRSHYVSKILSVLKPRMRLLDIGCGTAHIIHEMAAHDKSTIFVGLDVSPAMLKIAMSNTIELQNAMLIEGDGSRLPFQDCSFDIVITRLAEYSPREAHRVLRKEGRFFLYGLGPDANKEIVEFFPDRINQENFSFPKNPEEWKEEECKDIRNVGFVVNGVDDYREKEYHQSKEEIVNLIEMVPLVRDFDRERDRKLIDALAEKYEKKRGIKTTWHYFILEARKP
jgi:ubiquinone/menaquinone biosynthesis C-methylase UbiE